MTDRTQQQIMQSWDGCDECLVSIVCATYNHENYICEALNSFLVQETNFPFEIIIHDDASTDNTPDIIREYQESYPDIIKPIFQKENQYSKGKFKPSVYASSYASGKYIALCEGDDYWLDKSKLSRQVEALNANSECDICFHPARTFFEHTPNKTKIINSYSENNEVYPADIVIRVGGGFCPTASLMLKRDVFDNLPDWFQTVPAGDYYLQAIASLRGEGALYIPEVMSAYRFMTPNSVTTLARNHSIDFILKYLDNEIEHLELLNKLSNTKYEIAIKSRMADAYRSCSRVCLLRKSTKEFKNLIEQSWSIEPYCSKVQVFTYIFRKIPLIPYTLFKLGIMFDTIINTNNKIPS